ncbi:MAG: hypothetical protein GYB31_10355 [Bacteroidetes bacterium]|nr:hypothetical protein [Bacteroidota bacterium]
MISKKKFEELLSVETENAISLYIPTHRAGQNQEDKIRYKNQLSEIEDVLKDRGMHKPDRDKLMKPMHDLVNKEDFWLKLSDGLAVFRTENTFEHFEVPSYFDPHFHVGNKLHLYQLMNSFEGQKLFYLLAVSQNETRFFECRRHSITPIKISDKIPVDMEKSLALEVEDSLQFHQSGSTIHHGQGGGNEEKNVRLEQYFRDINAGLIDIIPEPDGPLVVACVDYLFPMYRKINTYPKLHGKNVSGNPEGKDPVLLHEEAIMVLQDWLKEPVENNKKQFEQNLSKDHASFSVHEILPAAKAGKVDSVFLAKGSHTWGVYDTEKHKVNIHENKGAESQCLVEEVARETYEHGGSVFLVDREEMPRPTANMNANFRY